MRLEHRFGSLVTACCFAAMLPGCGGGSSNTRMDTDTGMTDGGMMSSGGVATGPVAFMSGVDRFFSDGRTVALTDDGNTTITEDTTQSPSGWNVTVSGDSVEYSGSDLGSIASTHYVDRTGDTDVWFSLRENGGFAGGQEPEFEYLDIYGFSYAVTVPGADLSTYEVDDYVRASFAFIVHGTPTSDMPKSGAATYEGRAVAREWSSDAAVYFSGSTGYEGDFSMTATFGASGTGISGTFTFPEGTIPFTTNVNGNQLSISNQSINAGHFAGYEDIGVRAAFFGPAAAEAGGVFEGNNPTAGTLIHGWFAGEKQ